MTRQAWADRIGADLAESYGFASFGDITHEEGWTEYSWTAVVTGFSSPSPGHLVLATRWGTMLVAHAEDAAQEIYDRAGPLNPDLTVIDVLARDGSLLIAVPRPS